MQQNLTEIRTIYSMTMNNFLLAFSMETRKKLMTAFVGHADEVNATINWFNASPTVIKSTLWARIREDVTTHLAMIKLERMILSTLNMAGHEAQFIKGLDQMFLSMPLEKNVVDDDFVNSTTVATPSKNGIVAIPGLTCLLSIILFRDLWTIQGERA